MPEKRTTKRGNYRNVSHLCTNCFSTLAQNDQGAMICTGDRLQKWQDEYQKFQKLTKEEKAWFLRQLDNPERFLELASLKPGEPCGNNLKISHVAPDNNIRIPDPLAVHALERQLNRFLTEEELVEDYVFEDGYKLPFLNYPDDM